MFEFMITQITITKIISWYISRCRQLKTAGKIQSTWFFNSAVNFKLTDNGPLHKISHTVDIENILGNDNLEEYVNTFLFNVFSISIAFVVDVDNTVVVNFQTKLDLIHLI